MTNTTLVPCPYRYPTIFIRLDNYQHNSDSVYTKVVARKNRLVSSSGKKGLSKFLEEKCK